MKLLNNFKDSNFWADVLKLSGIFFILFVIISMIFANAGAFFSGDFAGVIQQEWGEGRWKTDLPMKLAITLIYSVYMVSRRRTFKKA